MRSAEAITRPALLALLCVLSVLGAVSATSGQSEETTARAAVDAVNVLRQGNRLFREGRLEEAYETYRAGWESIEPHPILLYNLATTAHHLGRLPEAILWYRRAAIARPGDPWVEENLEQARADLGLTPYPPPGIATLVARYRTALYLLTALLAWAGVGVWIFRPRSTGRLTAALIVGAALAYGAIAVVSARAAAPAVLLEDCSDEEADLPAGSELWMVSAPDGTPEALAGGARVRCPGDAIAPVDPAG